MNTIYVMCYRRSNPDAPLEQIKQYTSKVEDAIDSQMHWIRPWLPAVGRFLIVVTFLEDALRCVFPVLIWLAC
jgi:hypothetical protein